MKNLIILSTIFIFAACGNNQENTNDRSSEQATEQETEKPTEDQQNIDSTGTLVIPIVASGETMSEIKFSKSSITVPAETVIKIELSNESSDPTMFHNMVIIEKGTANEVGQNGLKYEDNDYVQPNDLNVIAHSELSEPNTTITFSFKTPKRGEYEFICSYPGHWGQMHGKFIVE